MTVTVRPPLFFHPHPRPKWWGTNPDAYEVTAYQPLSTNGGIARIQVQGRFEPRKYPPQVPGRMVGPQRPFKFYPLEILPKRPPPDISFVNITALLPNVAPQPVNIYEGRAPRAKHPPHIVVNPRSQPLITTTATNFNGEVSVTRKLPPPIHVRSSQTATTVIFPTALAQLQSEFDPTGKLKTYPPESVIFPPVVLNIAAVVLPVPPTPPEYPSKASLRWTEEAAYTNVSTLPPLIGIAQAMDDFSPTGPPQKRWAHDATPTNVVIQPLPVTTPIIPNIFVPWKLAQPWPEDAAATNTSALPGFTTPGFNYEYPSKVRFTWPIEPAPQDFWALPNTAIAPALYDYPALPKKYWPDPFPFTNWVQEIPPLPSGLVPPVVHDAPKRIAFTWDIPQFPFPLAVPATPPTLIPDVDHEIYIPYRRFTVATPARGFTITIPYRIFAIRATLPATQQQATPPVPAPTTITADNTLITADTTKTTADS